MKPLQSKFLCAAVLSLLAMTACKTIGTSESSSNSTANSAVNAASGQTVGSSDPKETLVSSMRNLQQANSWVADVNMAGDSMPQGNVKMNVKYSAPDNFQLDGDITGNKMQMVSVGGKTYLQLNGKWQEAPPSMNMGKMINNWKEMFSQEKLNAFKNIQRVGRETIDGKDLAVYTYEIDQQAAMPEEIKKDMTEEMKKSLAEVKSENNAKVWIDEAKNLPAKFEMTMKMSAPKETTQKISVNYKYDEEVKIEAPKIK